MARHQRLPDLARSAILAAHTADPSVLQQDLAEDFGVSEASVSTLLRRYEPVTHALKSVRRDLFTGAWQFAALENLDAMYAQKAAGTLNAGDRRNYMVAAAVASEKALLFAGQPTQIVAGMHEVRVELPALMARLAEVGTRMRALTGTTGGGEAGNDAKSQGEA